MGRSTGCPGFGFDKFCNDHRTHILALETAKHVCSVAWSLGHLVACLLRCLVGHLEIIIMIIIIIIIMIIIIIVVVMIVIIVIIVTIVNS